MKAEWRTSVVTALCRRMLDTRDFTPAPILADALQDAGCDDERLLAGLRTPPPPDAPLGRENRWIRPGHYHRAFVEKLVNIVHSPETAQAVDWLNTFVRKCNSDEFVDDSGDWVTEGRHTYETYEWLVESLREVLVKGGEVCFGSDEGADMTRGDDTVRRFLWKNWSIVTGVPVPGDVDDRVSFRCAC